MHSINLKGKIILLLILALLGVSNYTYAIVGITTTGNTAISADKSQGSSLEAFSTLNIVIKSGAATDFGANQTNVTFVLSAPANWVFNAGVGSVSFGGSNLSAASVNVTSTKITVTYSTTGTQVNDNSISITGIGVKSTSKANLTSIITKTSGTVAGFADGVNCGTLTQVSGDFKKLLILLTGETAAPGTITGKTGGTLTQAAGAAFSFTVYGVDENWNKISSSPADAINIVSSDGNASLPANANLSTTATPRSFSITLRTLGNTTITASNVSNPAINAHVSTLSVTAGNYSRLQILLPGETAAPGTTTGKTGTPTAQSAGTPFDIIVNAVDAAFNIITSAPGDLIAINSTDANALLPVNATLVSGTKTFSFMFKTAGNRTITASNLSNGSITSNTSPSTVVNPGTFAKLQLLAPGETAAAGTSMGKSGSPNPISAGSSITVTVNATDDYWNRVTAISDIISITSTDANAGLPANNSLSSGTRTFVITLRSPGNNTITASDVTSPAILANTGSPITVSPGAFIRLQLLLPGESPDPKSANGKTGTPIAQTAGSPFDIIVNAVDAGWNIIPSTDIIKVSSTDINAVLPADAALVSGTKTLSVILKTAGTRTITASDVSDPSKTSSVSPAITIGPNTFTKLQIVLPGETAAPGTATGKTGTATARLSAVGFYFTVNAVDEYWNKVTAITDNIRITTSDGYATIPADAALSLGTKTNFRLTFRSPGIHTITATDLSNGSITVANTAVTVTPGSFYRLQVLLPGETAAPGTSTGKTGSPIAQVAGVPYTITVNAVDIAWNIVPTATDEVRITSRDVNAILPANASLVSGTKAFTFTAKTAATNTTITATDVTDPTKRLNTSPYFIVGANTYTKLLLLLPGETAAPGSATGKTGSPSNRMAGTYFYATVIAVDAYWNRVTTVTDVIRLTCTDPTAILPVDAALVAGIKNNFRMTFRTIGVYTVSATNVTNNAITSYTSPNVNVTAGNFYKLQVLLPGETSAPGTPTGKTGTPVTQFAGTPFNVIINAVDDAWNIIPTAAQDIIKTTSNDPNAILPANSPIISGTKTVTVTIKTAGSRSITATDVTNGSMRANTSSAFTVSPGAFTQLQILLPSERAAPGTLDGKSGNPSTPARGTAFTFTVNAVDDCFNRVTAATNLITITSSDATATIPNPNSLVTGTRNFSINLKAAGLQTITATAGGISTTVNSDDPVKISAVTDYFRTITSEVNGAPAIWADAETWQSSTDGVTDWHPATRFPTSTANTITIQQGHSITITAGVTADQIIVKEGGELLVKSTLTLSDGPGIDMEVFGTVQNYGTINTTSGNLVFQATGKYQHQYSISSGTIPTATWNEYSTCEIVGMTSSTGTIGGANQSFYNLTWDCPNQNITSGPSFGGTFSAVNFQVVSTGTGEVRLATGAGTVNIKNYTQIGGIVSLNNSNSTALTMNVSGDFTLSGGTIQKGGGTGTGKINFNNTVTQRFDKQGGTILGAIDFTISNGAKVDFNTSVLNGAAAVFNLNAGGTLITANEDGISATGSTGAIQTLGRNFNLAANYVYNADDSQLVGSGLPGTVNNLTIDNVAGVSMPPTASNYTINGALTITGSLDMVTNNLLTGPSFSSAGTGTLYTQSAATTPLGIDKTWNVKVEYNSSFAQNIVQGTYSNLSFSGNGIKTSNAGTLNVTGNWLSTDGKVDLVTNNTNVKFIGTTQSLVDNDSEDGIIFKTVTFGNNGIKTLQSGDFSVAPGGLLSMAGTANLNANGKLTILSNETGSGNIGPITGGADIVGNVNIESFINGGDDMVNRGTRGISSPINDAGLARKTFQQLKDYIIITGPGNTSNGFDLGGTTSPNAISLQTYNEPPLSTGIYTPVATISQSASIGKGYFVFFRGNRENPAQKLNAPFEDPQDVTVRYAGPLNKGDLINSTLTNTHNAGDKYNGYNFVGNPYASAIDWNAVLMNSTNLDNMTLFIKPGGGTATYKDGVANNGGSRYIQTGIGFYVKVKDTEDTGTIKFTESSKVGTATLAIPTKLLSSPKTDDFLSEHPSTKSLMRIKLSDDRTSDETTVVFKTGYSERSIDDAIYFMGGSVSLGTVSSDGQNLSINFMPDANEVSDLKLWVNATESKDVILNFSDLSDFKNYDIALEDNLLNTVTALSSNSRYPFYIDKANPKSFGAERFKILIRKAKATPLKIVNFTAKTIENKNVELSWVCVDQENIASFILERSTNLTDFLPVKQIFVPYNSSGKGTYKYQDTELLSGTIYYRLRQTDWRDESLYSNLQAILLDLPRERKITVYPNPIIDETTVSFDGYDSPSLLSVFDLSGRKLFEVSNKTTETSVKLNTSSLSKGVYILQIKELQTNRIIQTAKLIKQ